MKGSYIDLLIRIKNGYMSGADEVISMHSKFKVEILKVLKKLKFIEDFSISKGLRPNINIKLSYVNGESAFTDLKILSKPGRKLYVNHKDIKVNKLSISKKVLTTSKGVMFDREAKKNKLGGELLFEIW